MNDQAPTRLKHAGLSEKILGVFYEVYNELGHGFIESVYEKSLAIALREQDTEVLQQVDIPVWFRGTRVGDFSADLLVDGKIIRIEIGSSYRLGTRCAIDELSSGNRC